MSNSMENILREKLQSVAFFTFLVCSKRTHKESKKIAIKGNLTLITTELIWKLIYKMFDNFSYFNHVKLNLFFR